MQSLDLLANNLANATTGGFKRDQEFYSLFSSDAADNADGGDSLRTTLPVVERNWTDFSPGALQVTGNPMDLAIAGDGFFVVNGPSGPLYTRNGSLRVLSTGELANADGYTLRGAAGDTLRLKPDKPVTVGLDGAVSQEGRVIDRLSVVHFRSTASLQKFGANCFQNSDTRNAPAESGPFEIQQGKLEGSNVPVAEAAMRLVGVMRQFELLQKAVSLSTEMDNKTIQDVARVTA